MKKNFNHETFGLLFNFVFIILTLGVVLKFYRNIFLTASFLSILTIIALVKWRSYQTAVAFFGGGFFLTLFEIMAVQRGILSYSNSGSFGIPFWLFFFWGNVSIFFYRLYIEIKKIKMKL